MLNSLKDVAENGQMMDKGVQFEYRGYILQQMAQGGYASEWAVINPKTDKTIEMVSPDAYPSFEAFKDYVDSIVDYDPDDMDEWLSRNE